MADLTTSQHVTLCQCDVTRLTLVEDDGAVVTAGHSTVRPLMADRYGVHYLVHQSISHHAHLRLMSLTFECPIIAPVELPVSNMKACPNLRMDVC